MPYIGKAWPKIRTCFREGCPTPYNNQHYHCGRCSSVDITSMLGHSQSDDGKTWYFTCEEKDIAEVDDV